MSQQLVTESAAVKTVYNELLTRFAKDTVCIMRWKKNDIFKWLSSWLYKSYATVRVIS